MIKRGENAGRSRPPQVPSMHFDQLMAVVDAECEGESFTTRRRRPVSARLRKPLSPMSNLGHAPAHPRPSSARPSEARPQGPGTPRQIMAAAVRDLPSLTDTLQEGKWISAQEADGIRAKFRMPNAPATHRPASSRPCSAKSSLGRSEEHLPEHGPQCNLQDVEGCKSSTPAIQSEKIHGDWVACCETEGFLRIVQELCSLGKSSETDTAIARTRALVREGLDCEGCSVFLINSSNGLVRNSLSAPELPETNGVVGRVMKGMEDMINVAREDTCSFYDQRIDRDPDLKNRAGNGLLAQGIFSFSGKLLGVILAVGKLRGTSFGNYDEMILKAIAAQVGMILGLCRKVRMMEKKFSEGERNMRLSKALNECRTSDAVVTLAKQYLKEITNASKVRFFEAELFEPPKVSDGLLDPCREQPLETAARAFTSGHSFSIEDMSANDQYRSMRQKHENAKSVLSVPIRIGQGGKILGVLQGLHPEPFKFSRFHCEEMEPMLFMIGKVLALTQMSDATLKVQQKLPKVLTTRSVRDAIFIAEPVAREVLSAQAACVFILNQTSRKIWTVHPTSSEPDEFDSALGLVGDCLNRNVLIQVPNALKDERYFERIDGTKCVDLGTQYRHVMLVPIRDLQHNRQLGILVVSRDQKQSFSHNEENFANIIAATLSAAFQICMEHEISEIALKENRNIMRLTSTMHHKLNIADLAQATILGTIEAMQVSECVVFIRVDVNGHVRKNDNSELKFRKFSLLEGRLQDELVMLDDAVISQAVLKGMLVNVTSQRMLNAMGYKRLHRLSAISGNKCLNSQLDRDPEECLLGPSMCSPLFTGLDRGEAFGAVQVVRKPKSEVFTDGEEQKFRFFCQHASSAFRRTFEREKLVSIIENHEDNDKRNHALCDFLEKIDDSKDLHALGRNITTAGKALGRCGGANFYRVETRPFADDASANVPLDLQSIEDEHFIYQLPIGSEIHDKRVSVDRGIPGEVRRRGTVVVLNQPSESAFFDADVDEPIDGGKCKNALGVPIFSKTEPGKVIAVLVLFNAYVQSSQGLSTRNFNDADFDRMQILALWISFLISRSRENRVSVKMINKIFATAMDDSLGNKVLEQHSKTHLNFKERPPQDRWRAVSEAIMAGTHCQAVVVFKVVPGEKDVLSCVYPAKANAVADQVHVTGGILREALHCKRIINVHDSKDDRRVSAECDNLDFLKVCWDAGKKALVQGPGVARYGDGKSTTRQALKPSAHLGWDNAVVVPIMDHEANVTGLLVAINKPVDKGVIDQEDIYLVKTLLMMAELEGKMQGRQGTLSKALQVQRNVIKDMSDIIFKSSKTITSTEMYAKDALTSMLRITKANYGAIYLMGDSKSRTCTKYDSQGSISNEPRGKSLTWNIMDTGSPINIPSATDLEASQVIPTKAFGSLRSIMGEPIIIDSTIQGALLVAWKSDGEPFAVQDEHALHDFALLFGSTYRLLSCVEELVSAVEVEIAIPRT